MDNEAAEQLTRNPKYHSRIKYIEVKYLKLREWRQAEVIDVRYIVIENNPADLLIKPLDRRSFERVLDYIGHDPVERQKKP